MIRKVLFLFVAAFYTAKGSLSASYIRASANDAVEVSVAVDSLVTLRSEISRNLAHSSGNSTQIFERVVVRDVCPQVHLAFRLFEHSDDAGSTENLSNQPIQYLAFFMTARQTWLDLTKLFGVAGLGVIQGGYLESCTELLSIATTAEAKPVGLIDDKSKSMQTFALLAQLNGYSWMQAYCARMLESLPQCSLTLSTGKRGEQEIASDLRKRGSSLLMPYVFEEAMGHEKDRARGRGGRRRCACVIF